MTGFLKTNITYESIMNRCAKFISAFFSPILIPTYSIVLALWVSPLRELNENIRMASAFTVLLLTALAPTLYIASMMRLGRRESSDYTGKWGRVFPGVIFLLCQLAAAYYLYKVYAPEWLVMILVAGAASVCVFLIANCFLLVSGHMTAMGGMCAMLYYLAMKEIADVNLLPWIIVTVLLAGLVGTARLQLSRHSALEVGLGFIIGAVTTYVVMNIHFFEQKLPATPL